MIAIFDPPGRLMSELESREGSVLVATWPEVYGSGPSTSIGVGWVSQDGETIKVPWNCHVEPVTSFQCWWPLPTATFMED